LNSRIQIIANGGAKGMVDPEARETFAQLVQSVLPGAGLEFVDDGCDIADMVKSAIDRGATIVAAGGGDGTINAVASELIGSDVTLGVLPLGTLNHFAKDVGIPVEVEEALAVLRDGRTMSIDVGCVSGRHFLNNSGLGLYPDMVHNRVQRQKKGASKWVAMMIEGANAFRKYRLLRLQFQVEGKTVHRRTPAVFVGNNDYSIEDTIASERTSLTDGQLCLYIPHSNNRVGLVWFSLRAFFGSPKSGSDFDKFMCTTFTINSHHKKLRVSIDGEVTMMQTPLEYCIKPAALRVQVPQPKPDLEETDG
jgi:YegS/Rv2252/BmrU family lipid kinase